MQLVEMLRVLWEIEESRYLASTTSNPAPKTKDQYGHNNNYYGHLKKTAYIASLANIDQLESLVQEEGPPRYRLGPRAPL